MGIQAAGQLAQAQNPEVVIAPQENPGPLRGGLIEARSGYLPYRWFPPGCCANGSHQAESRLQQRRLPIPLFASSKIFYRWERSAARLAIRATESRETGIRISGVVTNRVAMDVRIAFNELLLNRAKIRVREQSVGVLQEELKTHNRTIHRGASWER